MQTIDYSAIRDDLKTGDILAWRYDGFDGLEDIVPMIVSVGTRSPWYHIGVVIEWGARKYVYEAIPPFVRIYPASRKPSFYWLPAQISHTKSMDDALHSNVGDRYSLLKAMLTAIKRPQSDGKQWQCALLTAQYLRTAGWDVPDIASPGELVDYVLSRNGGKSQYVLT